MAHAYMARPEGAEPGGNPVKLAAAKLKDQARKVKRAKRKRRGKK